MGSHNQDMDLTLFPWDGVQSAMTDDDDICLAPLDDLVDTRWLSQPVPVDALQTDWAAAVAMKSAFSTQQPTWMPKQGFVPATASLWPVSAPCSREAQCSCSSGVRLPEPSKLPLGLSSRPCWQLRENHDDLAELVLASDDDIRNASPPRRKKSKHQSCPATPDRAPRVRVPSALDGTDPYRTPRSSDRAPGDFTFRFELACQSTPEVVHRSLTTPPFRPPVSQRCFNEEMDVALQQSSPQLLHLALLQDYDSSCCSEFSLVHAVTRRRHIDALKFLLSRKDEESGRDFDTCCPCCGNRPLDMAVAMSLTKEDVGYQMAEILVLHGAKPFRNGGDSGAADRCSTSCPTRTSSVEDPLTVAVKHGNCAMAELLMSHGADPNAVNSQGDGALHVICNPDRLLQKTSYETIKLLLQYRADPLLMNASSRTPKQCTRDKSAWEILDNAERRCQHAMMKVALASCSSSSTATVAACFRVPEMLQSVLAWL